MLLKDKVGLIIGVANPHSIAAGCAEAMAADGARLVLTYQSEKAKPYAQPVADAVGADAFLPLNVQDPEQAERVFAEIESRWGRLDFLVHSIAYCPREDLHAEVVNCSREGFAEAMDISCHSFIRMVKSALPLMSAGGSIMTVSYHGAEEVVDHYNIMGPVKAALQSTVRYLADDLGPRGIRVNTLSPGPMATRAASGIDHFDELLHMAVERSPNRDLATIEDVGYAASYLASDRAKSVTGGVHYIDGGVNIMA